MRVCLLVFTDGRRECLAKTLAYAEECLIEYNAQVEWRKFIVNDAVGDESYDAWLRTLFGGTYQVFTNPKKAGFCGTIQHGWSLVTPQDEFVFHLEDDFIFQRPPELAKMAAVLRTHPYLVQLALKRQPWNEQEKEAGGIVECHPEAYTEVSSEDGTWTEHDLFFTTNPSLYRSSLVREFPMLDAPHCEGRYTFHLKDRIPNCKFAFWGGKFDPPRVLHIGDTRVGTGY